MERSSLSFLSKIGACVGGASKQMRVMIHLSTSISTRLRTSLLAYSQSFSEFTFVRVFDFEGFWDSERCSMDTFEPVNEEDLRVLASEFQQQPRSRGWPGTDTYRYSCELPRITIWQSDGQSDWIMSGRSPSDLAQLKSQVAHLWRRHA